mmetsp:Transcript_5789/g.17232  ORF Transcript_5789/g.17232 Transcript_5789/m.17232 type:complete len:210 (+) Transcript_5789:1344-1973(+)
MSEQPRASATAARSGMMPRAAGAGAGSAARAIPGQRRQPSPEARLCSGPRHGGTGVEARASRDAAARGHPGARTAGRAPACSRGAARCRARRWCSCLRPCPANRGVSCGDWWRRHCCSCAGVRRPRRRRLRFQVQRRRRRARGNARGVRWGRGRAMAARACGNGRRRRLSARALPRPAPSAGALGFRGGGRRSGACARRRARHLPQPQA